MDGKVMVGADDPQTFEDVMAAASREERGFSLLGLLAFWAFVLICVWLGVIVLAVISYGLWRLTSLVFGLF